MSIAVVVLAAGSAYRYGRPKLLEALDERPLLQHALDSARAAALGPVYLVTGHEHVAVEKAAAGLADHVVFNPAHTEGMGTSITCGVTACRNSADAVLLLLADQPAITAEHLQQLASTWSCTANEIVATSFANTLGPPVLFGSAAFDELQALEGDHGAKRLLRDERFKVRTVHCDMAGIDIDTEADLDAVRNDQ